MNQEASEAIEILRTQLERPAFEGEEAVFPDLIDYVNAPGKSNATALLNKLREEGDSVCRASDTKSGRPG